MINQKEADRAKAEILRLAGEFADAAPCRCVELHNGNAAMAKQWGGCWRCLIKYNVELHRRFVADGAAP